MKTGFALSFWLTGIRQDDTKRPHLSQNCRHGVMMIALAFGDFVSGS